MQTAKIFWSGRSQAVRLPVEYRFQGSEVRIRRRGGSVILEPLPSDWRWLDDLISQLDPDFVQATEEDVTPQTRAELNGLFR